MEKIEKELIRIAKKKNRTKKETEFLKKKLMEIPLIEEKEFLEKIRTEINRQIEKIDLIDLIGKELL